MISASHPFVAGYTNPNPCICPPTYFTLPPLVPSSSMVRYLGIDCSVLMGANIAEGIAREEFSEAVIGER